jgi:SAM-dependent methyltransferase
LDVIVANNMIHHLAHPLLFFPKAHKVLKNGEQLLIQGVNCSFFMQRLLRLMQIKDFDFKINVFDINQICTNPQNPCDGNAVISKLLFNEVY